MASLGWYLVLGALLAASAGSVVAFAAAARKSPAALGWARRLALVFGGLMVAANLVMVYALVTHDFSVGYVAQVGSRQVPTWVSVVSLWSSLEGSILFWGAILGVYVGAAVLLDRDREGAHQPWFLGFMLACSVFFAFLIAGPANPFHHVPVPPADGPGPNPLLQNHVLMVVHPPALYLGYVGMVVPFALAMAALCTGKLGHDLLVPLRRWLIVPWIFLTIGIVLGGWWAYEVLGWGGYWAWDPVENASLLPWLTATAAIHSLLVVERRGMLKGWATTLVISTFLLTILGTFMTRSGIFNSVHSFTQSDIGPTFLGFLALLVVASLLLLSARMGKLAGDSGSFQDGRSREVGILVSNFLFVLLTFTVLLGTVFPLVWEAWDGVQISVGEPYFNLFSVPLGVAMLFLVGVGPALPWGRGAPAEVRNALLRPLAGGAVALALGLAAGLRNGWTLATLFAGGFALWVTVEQLLLPVAVRARRGAGELGPALAAQLGAGRRRLGAYVSHFGVIAILVAVAVSSTAKESTEVTLRRGGTAELGGYSFTLEGIRVEQAPHRQETIATVTVKRGGEKVAVLEPRMNHYFTQREPIGSPAVHTTFLEDVYLSAMSIDARNQVLGVRIFLEPLVGWIWGGTGIVVLGALLALFARMRRRETTEAVVSGGLPAAAAGDAPAPERVAAREVGT